MQNHVSKSHLRIRALTEGAILLALAVVLNYLSGIIFASLPQGGSITLAMFPLLLYVHRWGVGKGLLVCFAYGTMDMLLGKGYAWGWQSILLDYLVAQTDHRRLTRCIGSAAGTERACNRIQVDDRTFVVFHHFFHNCSRAI